MYLGILEEIIGRAAMDIQFRREMLEDPETALEEYELTSEQITALKSISADALEKFAHKLTESIGKGITRI